MTFATAGCEGALPSGDADRSLAESSNAHTIVDAGVVFAEHENYFCLRFEQFGLAATDTVTSVTSSCDCVQPSVVSYRSTQGLDASAVLLRFVKEDRKDPQEKNERESSSDSAITPVNLGVLIDINFADGSTRQITVNLLHTSVVGELTR